MSIETLKILGQCKPSAAVNTILYTVPENARTVVSTLNVCETGGTSATFRIYIVPSGGFASTANALYYNVGIGANDTFERTSGICLGPGDSIVVYASTANLCFQCFGSEVTP